MAVFRCELHGVSIGGTPWSSSFHVLSDGESDLEPIATATVNGWNQLRSDLSAVWHSSTQGSQLVVRQISETDGATLASTVRAISGGGSGASPALPADCAVVVSLITATFSRQGRGRMYLPPPTAGGLGSTDARLVTTHQDAYTTGVNHLFVQVKTVSGAFPIVWSRVAHVGRVVTALKCGNHVDTQRRRDVGPEVYRSVAAL